MAKITLDPLRWCGNTNNLFNSTNPRTELLANINDPMQKFYDITVDIKTNTVTYTPKWFYSATTYVVN